MKTYSKKTTLTPLFLFPIVVALGVSLFMAERGNAATITWDGGGTSNSSGTWSASANWNPDTTGGPIVSDTAILSDVSTGTRTITYDAGASGALDTLTFTQTSAATNSLVLNSNLTVTNSVTLGALAGGTSSITISPTGASQGITLKIPTLNVNSGGSLIFGFGANTASVPQTLSGNLTIAGGSVTVLTPNTGTAYGEVTGTLIMTSGSIYIGGDSSHGGRLQIDGNFTASGDLSRLNN